MTNKLRYLMFKQISKNKLFYFFILIIITALLTFIDIGWADYSILQAKSIDEFVFHRSILNIYEGFVSLNLRTLFSYGFYSYGFSWFFLNFFFSVPFLFEVGNQYAIIIPRLVTSLFFIMSIIMMNKLVSINNKNYGLSAFFSLFFILSMPGMWNNAVWFHPDFAMSFFLLCSLYFIVKSDTKFNKNYWLGILMFGIALSIKLQAITYLGVITLFYLKNYFQNKKFLVLIAETIKTFLVLLLIFVINNPYILHPTGLDVWLISLEANIISNSTNHGAGNALLWDRLNEGVLKNFLPLWTYFIIFFLSGFYAFKNIFNRKNNVLDYAGIFIFSNLIYMLFFVNKTWGHYYIPVMLLSPIILTAFFSNFITTYFKFKSAKIIFLAIFLVPQFYIFSNDHFEFFQLRVQDKTISRDSNIIVSKDIEIAKSDDLYSFLKNEDLFDKTILTSPYVNLPTKRLNINYRNYYMIFGPLSKTLEQRYLKGREKFDFILVRKDDIYFSNAKIAKMAEAKNYIDSRKIIDSWINNGADYTLKSQNKNYLLFIKKT